MMQTVNVPVQLISCCNTLGELTPMRFRYEDEAHRLQTVSVEQVLGHKETHTTGVPEIIFTCTAQLDGVMHMFELKYHIATHRWSIFRILR